MSTICPQCNETQAAGTLRCPRGHVVYETFSNSQFFSELIAASLVTGLCALAATFLFGFLFKAEMAATDPWMYSLFFLCIGGAMPLGGLLHATDKHLKRFTKVRRIAPPGNQLASRFLGEWMAWFIPYCLWAVFVANRLFDVYRAGIR